MYGEELIDNKEWDIFVGRAASVRSGENSRPPREFPSWCPIDRVGAFETLNEYMPRVVANFELSNDAKWSKWSSSLEPEKCFPSLRNITPFQRVLLIQALRPDRLQSALVQFAADTLHLRSIDPPTATLHDLYNESRASTPIIFITSAGADPSQEIVDLASKVVGKERYIDLAMGGGQQEIAMDLVRRSASAVSSERGVSRLASVPPLMLILG